MRLFARYAARRYGGAVLGELAAEATAAAYTAAQWRGLVARAAQAGDLDAVFMAYVGPTQQKIKSFIGGGSK